MDDIAGLLRWEVWRALPSKKLLFCGWCGRQSRPHHPQKRNFRGPAAPAPPPGEFASSIMDIILRSAAIRDRFRINNRIRAPQVRLIDEDGGQLGIVSLREALAIAEERGLDLMEVAPNAVPPVCRIVDYGKFRYEQTEKDREARKNQKQAELKEVRLKP